MVDYNCLTFYSGSWVKVFEVFDGKDSYRAMIDVVLVQEFKVGFSEEANNASQWGAKRGWKSAFSLEKINKEKENGICVVGALETAPISTFPTSDSNVCFC